MRMDVHLRCMAIIMAFVLVPHFGSRFGAFARMCYRCRKAQTFSKNFTTSLFPLSGDGKPCYLEKVRCTKHEHSCIYGLVTVVVAGGFWFHLSGCYVAPLVKNESRCYRGSGPVYWPGLEAQFRADYCLCADDYCNDSKFDRSVVSFSLSRTGSSASEEPMPSPNASSASSSTEYHQAVTNVESDYANGACHLRKWKRLFLVIGLASLSIRWIML